MRIVIALALVLLLAAPAFASLDRAGNYVPSNGGLRSVGDPCGQCNNPGGTGGGADFQGNDLIVYDGNVNIYRLQSCNVVQTITITPPPGFGFELGYDASRGYYLIADLSPARILQVNGSGQVVGAVSVPGNNPVGVAWDSSRDLYWVSDWVQGRIYSVHPGDGSPGPAFTVPAGTRIDGTGYDAAHDALVYHGRDQAMGFFMSAADGHLMGQYNVPNGGQNNGQGCGVDPTTNNVWLTHYEEPYVYCVEGLGGAVPTQSVTWGQVKNIYR